MITVGKNQTKFIPILLDDSGQARMTGKGLDVVLAGENASVTVVGLVLGKMNEEKVFEANIVHAARNTRSDVRVKGVLRGRSKFDFRGNVKIEKGAKGSNAYLRSDVLLFDDAKMGDDTPALEILEPDVKAGHAATIGKVDENMIFYLMSRGLTRKQAEDMIVEGFIEPMRQVILGSEATPESAKSDSGQARMTGKKGVV
jgi:Fe-S cluster assembly protein SufB